MRRSLLIGCVVALSASVMACDPGAANGKNTAALEGRLTEESGVSGAANDSEPCPPGLAGPRHVGRRHARSPGEHRE